MRILFALLILAASVQPLYAQTTADREAVQQAALDYMNAIYDVRPELVERSVYPDLSKTGNVNNRLADMSYEQLLNVARTYNTDNQRGITDETPRGVEILDILDRSAVVKLSAQWGVDYMLLTKTEGEWKILKVLWQTYPQND